jgi:zinc transporter ZupT
VVWFKKDWSPRSLSMLVAISTGLLLSVAIAGMIPHGMSESPTLAPWILIGMLTAFGFHWWHAHSSSSKEKPDGNQGAAWRVLSGMGIHSYFEGVALGAGFHADPHFGMLVFLALLLHKIPEGVAVSTLVMAGFSERKKAIVSSIVLGILTIFGTVTAMWLVDLPWMNGQISSIALLFSAGIILYVAGTELWPIVNQTRNWKNLSFFLSGILLYYILGWGSTLIAPIHDHMHHDVEAVAEDSHSFYTDHHHHAIQPVEIPKGIPVPTVSLHVYKDSESGWNLYVQTTNFQFAPEHVNAPGKIGEGHVHLYVDGVKVARLYGPWYHLNPLSPGTHEIRVELNTNQHAPYVYHGKKIEAVATIVEGE